MGSIPVGVTFLHIKLLQINDLQEFMFYANSPKN